jgi:hypothetical protein
MAEECEVCCGMLREKRDRSDPHYALCSALEKIAPLNGPAALRAAETKEPTL